MAERGEVAPLRSALQTSKDPAASALMRARLAASQLDIGAVRAALDDDALAHSKDPAVQAMAAAIAADAEFAAGDYQGAANAARQWLALPAGSDPIHDAQGIKALASIAAPLALAPLQTVLSRNRLRVATSRNTVGLIQAPATINGTSLDAVMDSGANLSVLSASTARDLKLRMLQESGTIGSWTKDLIAARIGVADRVELAGAVLQHVAFLVLDDAQLKLPKGGQIRAILGFPVFRALGCVVFSADGWLDTCAPAGMEQAHNLRLGGSNLFVDVVVNGIESPLRLDTGSTSTTLAAAFVNAHPSILDHVTRTISHEGSAGGTVNQQVGVLDSPVVSIAGNSIKLPNLDVAISDASRAQTGEYGTLGQDVLQRFDSYTLDLATMSFRVGVMSKK